MLSEAPNHPSRRALRGLGAFALLSLMWLVTVSLLSLPLLKIVVALFGPEPADGLVEAGVSGALMAGLAGIAAWLASRQDLDRGAAFALVSTPARWLLVGAVGAATLAPFGSWLSGSLLDVWPALFDSPLLDRMARLLTEGPALSRAALVCVLVVVAPLSEELVFRGFVQGSLERAFGAPRFAWVVASLAFASYHMIPLQVLSVAPLALVLGWLRLRSGSLWPSVAAHVVNNGLAVALLYAPGVDDDSRAHVLLGSAALVVTLALLRGAQPRS